MADKAVCVPPVKRQKLKLKVSGKFKSGVILKAKNGSDYALCT